MLLTPSASHLILFSSSLDFRTIQSLRLLWSNIAAICKKISNILFIFLTPPSPLKCFRKFVRFSWGWPEMCTWFRWPPLIFPTFTLTDSVPYISFLIAKNLSHQLLSSFIHNIISAHLMEFIVQKVAWENFSKARLRIWNNVPQKRCSLTVASQNMKY